MKFILEWSSFWKPGDIVLIEYWYNGMITPCKILEGVGSKWRITHNVPGSKIPHAPDEIRKSSEIISHYRGLHEGSQ